MSKGPRRDRSLNPIIFLDVQIGGRQAGRLMVELRYDICPRTCENFRALCTGERGKAPDGTALHLKGSKLHRIIKDGVCQGGDIANADGTWSRSVFTEALFADENFILRCVWAAAAAGSLPRLRC